jgi:hypothetical protein
MQSHSGASIIDSIDAAEAHLGAILAGDQTADDVSPFDRIRAPIDTTVKKAGFDMIDSDTMSSATDPDIYEALEATNPNDPNSSDKSINISALTPQAFASTCEALEKLYDQTDDSDSARGECKYELAMESDLLEVGSPSTCSAKIDNCEQVHETELLPIALCDDIEEAPEDCSINQAQIESCLVQHIDSRLDLAQTEICDDSRDGLAALQTFRNAQKCIEALADSCPSLLND